MAGQAGSGADFSLPDLPAEFELIARYFKPLAGEGALGLSDDAAIFTPPPGRQLVVSADAIVEGIHFLPGDDPYDLGRKLLRVNLSDLAAMGAEPLSYLLTLSVPRGTAAAWFDAFSRGLAADQREFGIFLVGGDTTSSPGPIFLSATVFGHVGHGAALRRDGAQPGDGLWVTGTIGDAALGLRALQHKLADPGGILARRYHLPQPRLGLALGGIAHACMDVSDGLVQDAGHLCRAGQLGVEIDIDRVPLSDAAHAAGQLEICLTGGDDYELLLAVPVAKEQALAEECAKANIAVTHIGHFSEGPSRVRVVDGQGRERQPMAQGWSHF